MARQARTSRDKRDGDAVPEKGAAARAKERRARTRPTGDTKAQTGQRREAKRGFGQFFRESYGELRKVEWPNQRQLLSATVAVIIAVAVVGAFLYVVDEAFSRLVRDVLLNL